MEGTLLYQQLTHELIGYGYTVYNRMKFGYQEKYYQRAYELELIAGKKKYSKEHKIVIMYNGRRIGRYFIDFMVEQAVVAELKVAADFHQKHIAQVLAYMRAKKLRVGLILLFTPTRLLIKRLVL